MARMSNIDMILREYEIAINKLAHMRRANPDLIDLFEELEDTALREDWNDA